MPGSDPRRLDARRYYDLFASHYEARRHTGYHRLIDQLEAELAIAIARGRDALEVGCGTGLILDQVAPHARRAVGIDVSAGMLAQARVRGLTVHQATATALPFADASFDATYSFKTLSHVADLAAAIAEMVRVTRPGGRMLLEVYNRRSVRRLLRRLRPAAPIGPGVSEDQILTRWYGWREVAALLPPGVRLVQLHGIRIFTLVPASLRWPVVGPILGRLERRARSTWLGRLGGFLVLDCVRTEPGLDLAVIPSAGSAT